MTTRSTTRRTRTAVLGGLAATALTAASLAGTGAATADTATAAKAGETSLATVLAADGSRFDKNHQDFDILEAAVTTVLQEKPDSALAAVADGSKRLTLFAPTDAAFLKLAKLLTGEKPASEKKAATAIVSAVDVDTLEAVLLYHVVPGKTLGSKKVLAAAAEKAELTTAQGGTVGVRPNPKPVRLVDADPDVKDPKAIVKLLDINKGNKQIAHGIDRVLLPIDL